MIVNVENGRVNLTLDISRIETVKLIRDHIHILIGGNLIVLPKSKLKSLKLNDKFFRLKDKIINMSTINYISQNGNNIRIGTHSSVADFPYNEAHYKKIIKHYRRVTSGWSLDYRG